MARDREESSHSRKGSKRISSDESGQGRKRSKSRRGFDESNSDSDDSYHRRKRSKGRSGSNSDYSDSENSEPDSKRRKKKSRVISEEQILEYMARKSQKKAVKVAKKLKAQAVSGYSNDSNPFGDSNLGEKVQFFNTLLSTVGVANEICLPTRKDAK